MEMPKPHGAFDRLFAPMTLFVIVAPLAPAHIVTPSPRLACITELLRTSPRTPDPMPTPPWFCARLRLDRRTLLALCTSTP